MVRTPLDRNPFLETERFGRFLNEASSSAICGEEELGQKVSAPSQVPITHRPKSGIITQIVSEKLNGPQT